MSYKIPDILCKKCIENHLEGHLGANYKSNPFVVSGKKSGFKINSMIINDHPSYIDIVIMLKKEEKLLNHECYEKKVDTHLKNLLYYTQRNIATQWGLTNFYKRYELIPSCFYVELPDGFKSLTGNDSNDNIIILKNSKSIRSPLMEDLQHYDTSSISAISINKNT